MDYIKYKGMTYPKYLSEGNAMQFILPFAKKFCVGWGYDIGCMKKEWAIPGAIPIDKSFKNGWDATHLPKKGANYIFSSHCLEHLDNWVEVLDYWTETLWFNGTLFLYLPCYDHVYWRPWNDRRHKNIFTPQIIRDYMESRNYINIFSSDRDLNDSFAVVGEK